MKLELKHLAAYLPYGVRFDGKPKGWVSFTDTNNMILCPIDLVERWQVIKPILRPLTDLTKEIEINGNKFIPIKELFELTGMLDWIMPNDDNYDAISHFKIDDDIFYYYIFLYDDVQYDFGYNIFDCSFSFYSDDIGCDTVENQLYLFNKMLEWHFDIYGLIDNGLAIDKNTIK